MNNLTSVWLDLGIEENQRRFYLGYLLILMAGKGYLQKEIKNVAINLHI